MVYELKRLDPLLVDADTKVLSKRLYRWLRSEGIVQRCVTHVAQNKRYEASVIDEFVVYVNEQIVSGNFGPSEIVNIYETNIEFDMIGSITLADQGSRTVSLRSTGSSSCCTVLLEVTLSGKKLPRFIIFKGNQMDKLLANGLALQSTQAHQFMQYKMKHGLMKELSCNG